MSNLVSELLKLAEKKKKPSGTATKTNPAKWEAAKRKAKAKMGGKHSARAMQLATKYYKEDGGGYKGKKPSASNNKLKKWTKQDWQWSGERKKESSITEELAANLLDFSKEAEKKKKKKKKKGKGVYLPAKAIDALKSSKKGRNKLKAASRKKKEATKKGKQVARHGLHEGKDRSKLGAADPNYRDRVALWLHDGKGNLLVQDDRDRGLGLKFPGGGIDEGQSVNDAAMREALEEVGYSLADKPRAIPGVRAKKIDWDPVFSAEAAAKGRNYKGSKHYHRLALAGDPDESLLGSEGDALAANWMPIAEVLEATRSAAANPDNKYNYFDEERLRAAEKVYSMLTQKTASDLQEVKDKLRVAILSGSTGDDPEELSRSRALAEVYRDYLTSHGAEVDWLDMRDMSDMPDTYDWDTDWYDDYKKRLTNADALVLSTPIFNYGPSGKVLQFLHRTLDKENQQFKPYSLLSGAGSPRSALALGGLANQLDTEIKGIGIGGGVQVAGDEFNVETGEMDPGIISRANENAAKLLQVAGALRGKTASYQSPYWQAYLIGQKLATADFGDNGSSDDMTLSFDSDVKQVVDPKDFASPEPHGNMTPSTNSHGWVGTTDEVTPDKTEATNYKRDYLERT